MKRKERKPKNYLPLQCSYILDLLRRLTLSLKAIKHGVQDLPHSRSTLRIKGQTIIARERLFITIGHQGHLQRLSSLEAIGFSWIATHQRRVKENKSKERKSNFDSIQITMKEEITYTGVTYSTSLLSFLNESRLSSQLHKEK